MNNENSSVKFLKFYIKNFYYVWYALIALCIALVVFVKNEPAFLMPAAIALLLIGTWLQRKWKKAIVEIRIEGEHVEIELYDKTYVTLGMAHITKIQKASTGTYVILSNKDEYRSLNGQLGAVIKKDGKETREFRKEDFPYAEFIELQ